MPSNMRSLQLADFTGGLNLRANPLQLKLSESPDLMNVDVDVRGGIRRRGGVGTYSSTALSGAPGSLMNHAQISPVKNELLARVGANIVKVPATGSATTLFTFPTDAAVSSGSLIGNTYFQNGTDAPRRYNGDAVTTLTAASSSTWNNDLEVPTNGVMPIAKLVVGASDGPAGYMFVANTTEDTKRFASRVRWSHSVSAAQTHGPEDWRDCDYIDIEPDADGDEIVALLPYRDFILVFKRNSVWGLYGNPPDSVYAQLIADNIGTVSPDAVVATEVGVFFFSWPEGLFLFDGERVTWLFEPLMPLIETGAINAAAYSKISVGYHNRRVFVSVPYGDATSNNRTYVLDTSTGEGGAWVVYDYGLRSQFTWQRTNAQTLHLATVLGSNHVIVVNADEDVDDFGGETTEVIDAWYQTSWIGSKDGGHLKWRRPEYIVAGTAEGVVDVNVFHDFEGSATRSHTIVLDAGTTIQRGDLLGKARLVSLRFSADTLGQRWQVNGVTLKYMPGGMKF